MAKSKNKSNSGGAGTAMAAIGVGLAGLAAGYFFLGPKGKKHQKQAKAWMIKMKGDVVERLENAQEVSEGLYHDIIDNVASDYRTRMIGGESEINDLATDLKKHWKTIAQLASGKGRKAKTAPRSTMSNRKAVKVPGTGKTKKR